MVSSGVGSSLPFLEFCEGLFGPQRVPDGQEASSNDSCRFLCF